MSKRIRLACWRSYTEADSRWAAVPHLAFESLAAHARHAGLPVDLMHRRTAADLEASDADVYAISSVTGAWPPARALAERLIAAGKAVVMGGPHLTCIPVHLPDGAIGVIGEGEETFVEVLEALAAETTAAGPTAHAALGIAGTAIWGKHSLVRGPHRPRLSLADQSHLPVYMEVGPGHIECIATRGCPYCCYFCGASRAWRVPGSPAVSRFDPDHVADAVAEHYRRRQPGRVTFQGLHFGSDPTWVEKLVHALIDRGAPRAFRVTGCTWSAANPDRRLIGLMKKCLGLEWLAIGMETASPALFKRLKPHLDVTDNERLIAAAADVGVQVRASFIVGTPGEVAEDLAITERFIREHTGPAFRQSGLFMFVPYPGTPAWTELEAAGRISPDMDMALLTVGANPARQDVAFWNPNMTLAEATRWRARLSAASRPA